MLVGIVKFTQQKSPPKRRTFSKSDFIPVEELDCMDYIDCFGCMDCFGYIDYFDCMSCMDCTDLVSVEHFLPCGSSQGQSLTPKCKVKQKQQ